MLNGLAEFQTHVDFSLPAGDVPKGDFAAILDYADGYSSLSKNAMVSMVVLSIIAHEYAHVEQHACNADAEPLIPGMAAILNEYVDVTCSRTSRAELAADLRGIDLAMQAEEAIVMTSSKRATGRDIDLRGGYGYTVSAKVEERLVRRLDEQPHLLMATALQEAAEYEAILGPDPARGLELVKGEPPLGDIDATYDYYEKAAERDWGQLPRALEARHIPAGIRAAILLSVLHGTMMKEASMEGAVLIHASRLYGWISGQLVAMQLVQCAPPWAPRTRDEAKRRGAAFLRKLGASGGATDILTNDATLK